MTDADTARADLARDIESVSFGDRRALQRVYDHSAAKLFGICLHMLNDAAFAEDALQEVYLKVWQHAASFDAARASPITWLCILARNTAIDLRRSGRRHADAVADLRETLAHEERPSALIDIADRDWLLARCLEMLDARSRAAISEAFLEGYTHAELAVRADVPLGTMKSWIRRALTQLRGCLADG